MDGVKCVFCKVKVAISSGAFVIERLLLLVQNVLCSIHLLLEVIDESLIDRKK